MSFNFVVGCDPELFLKDNTGKFICAHGVIPGTKHAPFPVKDGAIQVDGMAVEFNTNPATSKEMFVHNVKSVLKDLKAWTFPHTLICEPSVDFEKDVYMAAPPEALELGCEPDFDAYTGKENKKPDDKVTFRTASGHIHIGWAEDLDIADPSHLEDCRNVVKQLDVALGFPSLKIDGDSRRRKLYGRAGAFRPKPYGVEYRVLSNFWLKEDGLIEWVYDSVQKALNDLIAGRQYFKIYDTKDCINLSYTTWDSNAFIKEKLFIDPNLYMKK
jgi:hypothetical protein